MDIISLGAFVALFVLLVMAVILPGASLLLYLDIPSFVIVIAGASCALIVAFPFSTMKKVFAFLKIGFSKQSLNFTDLVNNIVTLAEGARKEGLLSLEDKLLEMENAFLKKGIQMAIDGIDEEVIRTTLEIDMDQLDNRHGEGIDLMDQFGAMMPAFGMIGTLIGLIMMLANLEDKSKVGSGMAAALITTLYGAIFANGLFIPINKKLEIFHKKEMLFQMIVVEGILSIVRGENTQLIKDKLVSFLSPDDQKKFLVAAGE